LSPSTRDGVLPAYGKAELQIPWRKVQLEADAIVDGFWIADTLKEELRHANPATHRRLELIHGCPYEQIELCKQTASSRLPTRLWALGAAPAPILPSDARADV
jgi:hypothetical protein